MSSNKSFSTETSERYSRALFEVAKEFGELEKVEGDIKNFNSLIKNSSEINNFIHNPTQSVENQNSFIELLSREKPIFEMLLTKERNNSLKLFSKFKKVKKRNIKEKR